MNQPDNIYARLADIGKLIGNLPQPQEPEPPEPVEMVSLASLFHGSDVSVSLTFPETGDPWMVIKRPGGEWWLAFNEESILEGLNDE